MSKHTQELFLLLVNLAQYKNKELIIKIFVESLNEIFNPIIFEWVADGTAPCNDALEVCTVKKRFGFVKYQHNTRVSVTDLALLQNAAQMLAVMLENIEQGQLLKNKEKHLQQLVDQQTSQLVTKKEELQLQLRESEKLTKTLQEVTARLQVMSDNMLDLVSLTDLKGNYKFAGASHKILGYDIHYLIGKNVMDFVHPDDLPHVQAGFVDFLTNEKQTAVAVYRNRCADGKWLWFETIGKILYGPSGKPHEILFNTRDITRRKEMEEKLNNELRRRRILMEQSRDGIVILNQQGMVVESNNRFAEMLGYPEDAMTELTVFDWEFLHEPDRIASMLRAVDEKGDHFESMHRRKDGSTYHVEISTNATWIDGQKYIFCVCRDITERKQSEELNKQLEIAKKTLQFKQNFLANMSHEIRTPLTGVLGMVDILEQTKLNEHQHDYVQTLKSSGQNLREIIDQVLDYSKIEAGKITFYPSVFQFSQLHRDTIVLFKDTLKEGVTLTSTIDPKIPPFIEADKYRIKQILNNLVSNAIKFTPQGSITIHSEVVSGNLKSRQLVIKTQVTDTGIGISEAVHKKLFTPFFQVESADTRSYEGTGLGLPICKQLAEMMGGHIGVQSNQEEGSTFWVTYTACIAEKPKAPPMKKEISFPGSKLNILLVEDKIVNQKVIRLMLTSLGHQVVIANNGQQALNLFQPKKFDLILMDIQMPVMDGVTATQKLKEKYNDLPPIVGLSANAFEGDREKYMGLGMDEYLTKPVKKGDFERLIGRLFSQNQNPQSG